MLGAYARTLLCASSSINITADFTYCLDFTFEVFDYHRSGFMTRSAVKDLLTLAYGKEPTETTVDKIAIDVNDSMEGGTGTKSKDFTFDLDQFRFAVRLHSHLMQPILQLQV